MIAVFGMAVFFRWPAYQALWRDPAQAYSTWGNYCSPDLVRFLIKHPPEGRGFNFYDWGGYLIGSGVPTVSEVMRSSESNCRLVVPVASVNDVTAFSAL